MRKTIYITTYIYLYLFTCKYLFTYVGIVRAIDNEKKTIYITTYICLYIFPVHFYLSVYISVTNVGMVRAIDMERKTIYITTPLSLVDLVYVNTLIRGSSNVPQQIFTEQITRVGFSSYLCTRPWQRFSEQIIRVGLLQSCLWESQIWFQYIYIVFVQIYSCGCVCLILGSTGNSLC